MTETTAATDTTAAHTPFSPPTRFAVPGRIAVSNREATLWQTATLTKIRRETPAVSTFRFAVPGWTGHLPGQHLMLRLTADGYFVNCLYGEKRANLRDPLREGGTDPEIAAIVQAELDRKWAAHPDLTTGAIPVLGTMSQIGG